jgi:hypothetical protein
VLELWAPEQTIGLGRWIPATLRVTNAGRRTVIYNGTPEDLRCHPPAHLRIHYGGLLDPGEAWTGRAARWKAAVIAQSTEVWLHTLPLRPGLGCADYGLSTPLRPGDSFTFTLWGWMRSGLRDQALPSGRVPLTASFRFETARGSGDQVTLQATTSIRTRGRPFPYPTPGQLADAALRSPGFLDWMLERDGPRWGWQVDAPREESPASMDRYELVGEPGTDASNLGLWADSWTGDGSLWWVLLDPWTGEVFGHRTE